MASLPKFNLNMKALDWRVLNRYTNSQATKDLNKFLEKLPQHTGNGVLIAAGIAWALAAGLGLFTSIQVQQLTALKAKLVEAEALLPIVPVIKENPVDTNELEQFAKSAREYYKGLDIRVDTNKITVTSSGTDAFPLFREFLSQVPNGGQGWKITLDSMCAGRECKGSQLSATLKVNKITVDKPASPS